MDWTTLFSMQETLDKHIIDNHQLQQKDLMEEKYLALLVELGELANETRCFKFWSTKPASARKKILEEYVDGVHFILSLGIEKGYQFAKDSALMTPEEVTLTEQFNNVFQAIIKFRAVSTQENYHKLFRQFLQLGHLLDFSSDDIYQAYIDKNEVNFARQADGY